MPELNCGLKASKQLSLFLLCEFIFGLEDIVADIRILETGSNSCAVLKSVYCRALPRKLHEWVCKKV